MCIAGKSLKLLTLKQIDNPEHLYTKLLKTLEMCTELFEKSLASTESLSFSCTVKKHCFTQNPCFVASFDQQLRARV